MARELRGMNHFDRKTPLGNTAVRLKTILIGLETIENLHRKVVLTYLGRCFSKVDLNWVVVTVNPSWNNSFVLETTERKQILSLVWNSVLGKTNVAELAAPSRAGSDVKGQPCVYVVGECSLTDPTLQWLEIASTALVTAWFKMLKHAWKTQYLKQTFT